MKKDIVIRKQLYKIIFKEEKNVKIITPGQFDIIKEKLFKNEWIEVDGELYNPFEIKKIVKYQTQDGIAQKVANEIEPVQKKVKEYMRLYKKELTLGVVENMIIKAKEELKIE